jgi:DMSO reductase family type II enzyme heme b subunit
VAWRGRDYGRIGRVEVRVAHNGEAIFFRLNWRDETPNDLIADTDQFTDACAVLFPLKGDAVLTTMGDTERPVNAWYWRAGLPGAINVTATGLGAAVRHRDRILDASSSYAPGSWSVVVARPFQVEGAGRVTVALAPGRASRVGFAVWDGGNQERAGLKAVSLDWQELLIEG